MKEKSLVDIQKEYGISRRAIQGYEKMGLIHPTAKTKRGYLLYDEQMVRKIRRIRMYQQFGFSLKEIVNLFKLDTEKSRLMLKKKLDELKLKRIEIDELIELMERMI